MKRVSVPLGAVWEDTLAFVKAEFALLAPLSLLGFGLPMVALLLALPMAAAQSGRVQPGPWMLWMVPCGLVSMLGSLAVSALTVTPGLSVRESIVTALRRFPAGLGLFLLYVGVQVALSIPLAIAGLIEGSAGPISSLVYFVSLGIVVWLFVRVMPIWAVLADRAQTPWAAATHAWRLTRDCYGRLLLLRVVMAFAMVVTMVVLLVPIGALTRLIGLAAGNAGIGIVIAYVCMGAIVSTLVGIWTVYVALLYRRLGAVSSGT